METSVDTVWFSTYGTDSHSTNTAMRFLKLVRRDGSSSDVRMVQLIPEEKVGSFRMCNKYKVLATCAEGVGRSWNDHADSCLWVLRAASARRLSVVGASANHGAKEAKHQAQAVKLVVWSVWHAIQLAEAGWTLSHASRARCARSEILCSMCSTSRAV